MSSMSKRRAKTTWSQEPDQGLVLTLDATGYARIEMGPDLDGGILYCGDNEVGWVTLKRTGEE